MATFLLDASAAPPDTGPAGPAANPIPKRTTLSLERGLVRLGKRIEEAGTHHSYMVGIWRRPEHLHAGRLCIQPRRLRNICTKSPITPAMWARFERACKPRPAGAVRKGKGKAKVPTLATALRVLSSICGGALAEQAAENAGAMPQGLTLEDTLDIMYGWKDPHQVEWWEAIMSSILAGLGKV